MNLSIGRSAPCLAALAAATFLAGCMETSKFQAPASPVFYNRMDSAGAVVDANAAASMISGYRINHGLNAVVLDPKLMKMAAEQARIMAVTDDVGHDVKGAGSFEHRLNESGFDAGIAAENVGAGYRTLAEAFSGWRDSPHHNANMLKPGVTRIGIATAYAPKSKYKVYWSLELAKPYEPPKMATGPLPADGSTVVTFGGATQVK